MRVRRLLQMAVALAALVVGLCAFSGAAGATERTNNGNNDGGNGNNCHCGYPPPPIGTYCSFVTELNVGSSSTVVVTCRFAPSSKITIALNGHSYGTATAPASGFFIETFKATSPHDISLNGGTSVSVAFGAVNTFVASGTNPAGKPNVAATCVILFPRQQGGNSQGNGQH